MARKPGPATPPQQQQQQQQPPPPPSPPPLIPRLRPKQEKRDASPIPVPSRSQIKQQFKSSPQQRSNILATKNVPLTRSQLHKSSPATIEPVDPLRLLRTKMVHENLASSRARDKMVLRKLPLKKIKKRKSPERDSVCIKKKQNKTRNV